MLPRTPFTVLAFVAVLAAPIGADEKLNFNRDIRPILSDKCFSCHGLDKNARQAELRLDQRESALERKAIVPGQPDASSLVSRIFAHDAETLMPPIRSNKPLSDAQKSLLKKWVEEGADYQPHWSFIPVPAKVPIPNVDDGSNWIRSPIDAFVLARLRREKLEPAVAASREKWLRRASFDLTGLPPTLDALDTFLSDATPLAEERAVDRLLKSPAYGERMTNEWLDVARYADTFGYQSDREMHVWPWRDWVIRAFNDNLSFDQFITWQTAGDLLPNPTHDQQLATAFNRLHRQTNEGGSIEEEFRQTYIADRVVTNGTAFLGMTFECARCHDHKYDPIAQADFYKLAAFFSNIDEHGLYSHYTETAPTPALGLYAGDQQTRHMELVERIRAKSAERDAVRQDAEQRYLSHPLAKFEVGDEQALLQLLNEETATAPKFHLRFDDAKLSGENKLVPGISGQAIEFSGEDVFTCTGSGQFGRSDPFTISAWLKPAEQKPRMIVLHQCVAAEDAAFRGYSLVLDNGHLQFSLVHFWPGNAIQVQSVEGLPLNEWSHVTVTYDGSSLAHGVQLFVNGRLLQVTVNRDQLTRDIKYRKEWGDSKADGVELSLGARSRDVGFHHGLIDELSLYDSVLSPLEINRLYAGLAVQPAKTRLQPISNDDRLSHYLLKYDGPYRAVLNELQSLRRDENELITQVRQIMVMKESQEPRPSYVLKRGAYDARGELVTADTPTSLLPFSPDYPRNRLGLARWLVDDRNPLTSRVAVNRFWGMLFGRGLVASVEDLGGQGQPPSHPELLDWLARDFMQHGWDVKRFCKQVVLSATYRQSTVPRDARLYKDDPENVLLARGSRYRLTAEQIRDNALAVSGLLVAKIGGPSVMPYQPVGLWEESGTGKSYHQSKGEGLYRRSMYSFWRRTSPPPSMLTFDAQGREVCTARRERTATPLQALVLLNDPQFIEAARVLAERLLKKSEDSPEERVTSSFRLLTNRLPTNNELAILMRLFAEQKRHFEESPDESRAFLAIGDAPHDEKLNSAELAALTVVVKAVMSFDECVTRR